MNTNRLKTVVFTVFIVYIVILCRLFYWQIIKYDELHQKVIGQSYKTRVVPPIRGEIYDSLGYPLVLNQTQYILSIYKPDLKTKPDQLLTSLKLNDENQLIKFFNNPNQKWFTLKEQFNDSQRQQFNDPGLTFTSTIKRFYPENDLGRLFIGDVSHSGLEGYYNRQLRGKPGFVWESKDATGKTILSNPSLTVDPVNGRHLYTSINRQIQSLVENSLRDGVNKFSADSGSISIISPQTGAIIAMSNFIASSSAEASASAYQNPIISNLFEPGSIFKPLVMSMALDTNLISDDYICTKCSQPHQIGQYSIGNWDNEFHANSSLKDIIKNSDNIGMSHIVARLGLNNFLHYFQLLNLDRKTGIDLQGETKPIAKNYWSGVDLATASFGQGFAITQMQMLAAFNVLANNGRYVHPHLVNHFQEEINIIANPQDQPIDIYQPTTISKIRQILQYAVENGVVAKLKPSSLEVCAKSGTSQIAIIGGYSDSSTIASYIGFSPCQNPKFTMIVTINNPRTSPWGSSTAAPVWYEIASKLSSLL